MITALVPAAGMSTRLGRNKLLLPFKGKPLIARAVETLLASAVDEIIIVLGHEAEQVRARLDTCHYRRDRVQASDQTKS